MSFIPWKEIPVKTCSLLLMILLVFSTSIAKGEDLLLKIECLQKVAYGEEDIDWIKAKTIATLETEIKLDRKFHVRMRDGFQIYTMTGEVKRGEKDFYTTKLAFKAEQETLSLIPISDEIKEFIIDKKIIRSTVSTKLDAPLNVGGSWVGNDSPRRLEKTEFVMTISQAAEGE